MSEQRDNRAIGCLGAIVGWFVLGALTSATFRWLLPQSFDPRDAVMVLYFKIVEGSILGATTTLAFAWSRKGEYQKAGRLCLIWGGLVTIFWLVLFAFGNSGDVPAGESLKIAASWGAATFIWATSILVIGIVLFRKQSRT